MGISAGRPVKFFHTKLSSIVFMDFLEKESKKYDWVTVVPDWFHVVAVPQTVKNLVKNSTTGRTLSQNYADIHLDPDSDH